MRYPVVLTPDDNDTLLVTCPDIPEVTTFGEDREEAVLRAVDAIETALMGRISQRQPIPDPSKEGDALVSLPALSSAKVAL